MTENEELTVESVNREFNEEMAKFGDLPSY